MKQYKVIIADSSEEFCAALRTQLAPLCQVKICQSGWQTLEILSEDRPEVLVLDLMLPKLDGISLLSAMSAAGYCPAVLATTCCVSPWILRAAEDLSVACLMEKPCTAEAVGQQVQRLLQQNTSSSDGDLYSRISGLLLSLGFSPKLRGYAYLREAVACLKAHRGICIIKDLYPRVGKRFGVSAEDVEHSIRGAVLGAWKRRKPGIWEQYLQDQPGQPLERPTNSALILALEEKLEAGDVGEKRLMP